MRKDIAEAIKKAREERDYHVTVGPVSPATWVADCPIPPELEGYSALVACTEHNPPCCWADFAFRIGGQIHVVLQNDFGRIGMLFSQSIPLVLRELVQKLEKEGKV